MNGTMELRVGDQVPWLYYETGQDMTGVLSVTFSLRERGATVPFIDDQPALVASGTYVINNEEFVLSPTDGVLIYQWAPADTAIVRSSCEGVFKIQRTEGQETWPSRGFIRVTISENL